MSLVRTPDSPNISHHADILPALYRERDSRARIWDPKPRPLQLAPPPHLRLTGARDLRHVRPRGRADGLQGHFHTVQGHGPTPVLDDPNALAPIEGTLPGDAYTATAAAAIAATAAAATATATAAAAAAVRRGAAHGARAPHPEPPRAVSHA